MPNQSMFDCVLRQGGGIDDVFTTTHTYMKKRDAKCVAPHSLLHLLCLNVERQASPECSVVAAPHPCSGGAPPHRRLPCAPANDLACVSTLSSEWQSCRLFPVPDLRAG